MPLSVQLKRTASTVILLCSLVSNLTAHANVGEAFGFGARTAALGGAGASFGYGGFAAYHNPAGLPFGGEKRLILDVGVMAMVPMFLPIRDIVVENAYVSDKVTRSDVDNDYRSAIGQQLGLVYRLFPEALNFTFGEPQSFPFLEARGF